ncbi:MAG: DNA-directed RNA polymerase sigma-70 factor [Rhodothermaceae bacterium]|nr:MAG: DNA-directed RNA polymerase sigma-70 factor [Rhodothermaceae bacterium]
MGHDEQGMSRAGEVTQWLRRMEAGESEALEHLMPLLYDELRSMARHQLRNERAGHTLNPTALVNEVYLRLARQENLPATHRTQFLGVAGRTMRRVLIDYARARKRLKRGGGQSPIPLEEALPFLSDTEADEILALDDALDRLAAVNERGSEVVQYRFFSGLTLEETAEIMGLSLKTVHRAWIAARAWLRKEVAHDLGW